MGSLLHSHLSCCSMLFDVAFARTTLANFWYLGCQLTYLRWLVSPRSLGKWSNLTTLPKFNSEFTPEKLPISNRKGSSSNESIFRGELLNFGGVTYFSDGLVQPPTRLDIHWKRWVRDGPCDTHDASYGSKSSPSCEFVWVVGGV